jgi:hypothetical protein
MLSGLAVDVALKGVGTAAFVLTNADTWLWYHYVIWCGGVAVSVFRAASRRPCVRAGSARCFFCIACSTSLFSSLSHW